MTRVGVEYELITPEFWIWSRFDQEAQLYLVVAQQKVSGGILQLIHHYQKYQEVYIKRHLKDYGNFSIRPFTLGRGCDGTTDECCHALYYDFCTKNGLNPIALYREAYADRENYSDPNYMQVQKAAHWQGVIYPQKWGPQEIRGLLKSLYAINNRSLVEVLEQTQVYQDIGEHITSQWNGDY